jgi:hypothetical protein
MLMERPRRAAAASVRFRPTSTASGGRGSVTTTSTSFPEARDGAAAPPPARSARVAAGASARERRERRKRRHGTRAVAVGARGRGYTVAPRGCGGIGRRARFRSVWEQSRGGSSPLIRIGGAGSDVRTGGQDPGCVFTPIDNRDPGPDGSHAQAEQACVRSVDRSQARKPAVRGRTGGKSLSSA